jgi:hypothetical protein
VAANPQLDEASWPVVIAYALVPAAVAVFFGRLLAGHHVPAFLALFGAICAFCTLFDAAFTIRRTVNAGRGAHRDQH